MTKLLTAATKMNYHLPLIALSLALLSACSDGLQTVTTETEDELTADAGVDQIINEGNPVNLSAGGSINAIIYSWEQISGGSVIELSADDQSVVSFDAPLVDANSVYTFRLTVFDTGGNSASDEVSVTVIDSAPAVAVAEVNASEVNEGEQVQLSGNSSQAIDNGVITSYQWHQVGENGATSALSADSVFEFTTPDNLGVDTTLTFRLTVVDDSGTSDSDEVELLVNNSPTAQLSANYLNVNEGDTVEVSAASSRDSDSGTIVNYLLRLIDVDGQESTLYDGNNAPVYSHTTSYISTSSKVTFLLTVTDNDGASSADDLIVDVLNSSDNNQAPQAEISYTNFNGELEETSSLELSAATSSDVDGEIISYLWQEIDDVGNVRDLGTTSSISYQPPDLDLDTEYQIVLTVTDDDQNTGEDTLDILILNLDNEAPIAVATSNLSNGVANENIEVVLSAEQSYDDSNIATYSWEQIDSNNPVNLNNLSEANASFIAPAVDTDTTYTFRLTLTDAESLSASDEITILVNNGPTASTEADFEVNESSGVLDLVGSGSDTNGGNVWYSWAQSGGSPAVSIDKSTSATASFVVPEVNADTTVSFELTVSDYYSATDTSELVISINNSPTASISTDFVIANEITSVELDGSASSDTDGGSISYSWQQSGGSPLVSIDTNTSATASFTTPEVDSDANLTFQLTVTDNDGASASATTVVQVNNTPTVSASASATRLTEGDTLELNGSASDTDGDTIASYSWQQVNSDSSTTEIATTANYAFTTAEVNTDTSYTFRFTAIDSQGASVSIAEDITVTVNNSPTATTPSSLEVNESTDTDSVDVSLDGSASVDNGSTGIASYVWQQVDSNGNVISDDISINQADAAIASFTAPEVNADTELTFKLTVSDADGATASASSVVTINNYPTATVSVDATELNEGDSVTLDGTGSDTDNGTVTHSWHSVDSAGAIETLANTDDYQFTAPEIDSDTSYTFRYTVTDNDGASVSAADIVITVNNSPTAVATSSALVNENAEGNLDGSGSSDTDDGSISTYQWLQVAADGNELDDENSLYVGTITPDDADPSKASFTAPEVDKDETLYFRLTVSDNNGAEANVTTSTVINNSPEASISEVTTQITEGDSITLEGTGSDTTTATDALIYQWQQVNADSSTTDLNSEPGYTFTSSSELSADASYTFRFTVTDEHGASNSEDITIDVDNTAPSISLANTSDTTADEGELEVDLDGSASSGGITSYLWSQVDAAGNLVEADNAVVIADPSLAQTTFTAPSPLTTAAAIYLRLTINDDDDDTPEVNATVSFNIANSVPPAVTALADFSADEGETDIALSIATSSGGISSYLWQQVDDQGNVISDDVSITNATSATASFDAPKHLTETITLSFRVSASDDDGQSASDTVAVSINNSDSPTADVSTTTVTTVTEGTTNVSLDGSASSGGISAYKWEQILSNVNDQVTITDATSAQTSFDAPDDLTATVILSFELTVQDSAGLSDSTDLEITVTNTAPTIDLSDTATTANEGEVVSLDAGASSGGISSYLWQQVDDQNNTISDGVSIDNADAEEASFTAPYLISSETASEVLTFKLTIDDDDSATDPASATIAITINDVTAGNFAPTANAGADQTAVEEGAEVQLSGLNSSDSDGIIVSYSWVQTDSAGNTITSEADNYISLTGADSASPSFTAPYLIADTSFTFDLTVTDDDGATSSSADSVIVTVLDVRTNNALPEIEMSSGFNLTVDEGADVSLKASVSDSDGYVVSYSWLQTDSTGNTLIANTADNYIALTGADTTSASFTAPGILNDSITSNTYYFRLSVTDDDDDQGVSDLITVVVNNTYTSVEIAASAGVAPDFDQLSLSWDAIEGLTYNLYRSSESDCDLNDYTNCDKNALYASVDLSSGSQIDSGLEFFTSYYYWLEAQVDTEIVFSNSTPLEANTTGPVLNDTGVTQGGDYPSGFDSLGTGTACNGGYLVDDNGDVIADPDNHSGNSTFVAFDDEDCELGRDADDTLNDDSDGNAGFSFTRLNLDGSLYEGSGDYGTDPWACVLDNVTGLIWEVKTNDNTLRDKDLGFTWYDPDNTTFTGTESDQDTDDFITHVNSDASINSGSGLCGRSNWRLPTVQEIYGLTDYAATSTPFIDTGYFPNTQNNLAYWAADLNVNPALSDYVWAYDPFNDQVFTRSAAQQFTYARLVSSSEAVKSHFSDYSDNRYTDHGDGTISDTKTGLMWMKCTYGQNYDSAASSICGATSAAIVSDWRDSFTNAALANDASSFGYTDWRLPNIKELGSLVDFSKYEPAAINTDIFAIPNNGNGFYWSSTPTNNKDEQELLTQALLIGFGPDQGGRYAGSARQTSLTAYLRLVRDDINTPRIFTLDINGDNVINSEDDLTNIPVSGSTIDIEDGQQITLVIDTTTFFIEVSSDTVSGTIDLSTITDGIDIAVTADAFDIAGRAADQFTSTLLKDTEPPSIALVVVATDNIINSAEASAATISGTTEGVEDGQSLSLAISDGTSTVEQTVTVTGNAFSITNLDLSGLADGTSLNLTADVADAAGNPATPLSFDGVIKDTAAPSITSILVAGDDLVSALEIDNLITVSGSIIDIESGAEVSLVVGGVSATAFVDSQGAFTTDVDLSSLTTDGPYSVSAAVSDAAGNAAPEFTSNFIVDTAKPSITSVLVAGDNFVNSSEKSSSVAVSGTTDGVEDNQEITLSINGADITATVSSNNFATSADLSSFNDGTYNLSANVADAAGNPADEATDSFEVDTAAPAQAVESGSINISIDSGSSASDFLTNATAQTIGAELDAALGTGDVLYASVDSGTTWQQVYSSSIADTTISWAANLAEGTNFIQFQVADAADNNGSLTEQSYTLDTTPPTQSVGTIAFSVDSGTAGDLVTNTAAQTITATLSAELENGDRLFGAVSLNGENDPNWVNITSNVNVQAISWATTLSAGTNEVQFSIEDAAGNSATTTQAYTLDQTNPSASASDVSADEASTATLNASASSDDLSGIASYAWAQVDIDGNAFSGAALTITDSDSTQASVTTPSIAEDSIANQVFYFAVTVTDKADNSATSSPLTLTVSNNYTTPNITSSIGAAPDFDQISLSWSVDTSLTYSLYRSTDLDCVNALASIANIASCDDSAIYTEGGAEPAISISADTARITDTGLEFFTNYYYWLEAKLSSGEVVSLSSEQAATTSGPVLNDTGITGGGDYPSGFDNHNGLADGVEGAVCNGGYFTDQGAVVSDLSSYSDTSALTFNLFTDEDCELGRDANATLNDDSNGNAAFVFTKLDIDGTELPADASAWSCVLDHTTGLIWEVKTTDGTWREPGAAFTWYNPNHGQELDKDGNAITFYGTESDQDTQDFIAYLNSDSSVNSGNGLCGLSNWRLPTVHEIEGLADYDAVVADGSGGYSSPSIDTDYFPYASTSQYVWYWTSHLNVDPDVNPSLDEDHLESSTSNYYAWSYGSAESRTRSGTGSTVGYTGNPRLVRLVSSSAAVESHFSDYSDNRYTDNGDGTISDAQTGLMWSKCSYGQTYDANDANSDGIICEGSPAFGTWQQAFAWAADSTDHGHSDWRLPNIKELGSIVDFGSAKPAINQSIFPNTASGPYWTSTPSKALEGNTGNDDTQTIFIGFQAGDYGPSDRISNLYLRLVRNLN